MAPSGDLQGVSFDGICAGEGGCPALVRFRGRMRGQSLVVLVEGDVPTDAGGRLDWASAAGEAVLEKLGRVMDQVRGGPVDRDTPASGRLFA